MAIAVSEFQILWSTASSLSVAASGTATSDSIAITATVFQAQIQIKLDHSTTPGAADFMEFWLLVTLGDPDGAGADEFATTTQGQFLGILDPQITDPAIAVFPINMPVKEVKLYVENNAAEAQTVSATILGQTG